jgi:hypothetical protein
VSISVSPFRTRSFAQRLDSVPSGCWLALALAMAVLGAIPFWNLALILPADTIWLIHAGERLLDGATLYADIIETNPPMSVLLYLPGILAARMTGISAQSGVVIQSLLVIGLSLALSAALLQRHGFEPYRQATLLAVIALVLLFMPNASFTQREHYALVLLLPFILHHIGGEADTRAGLGLRIALAILAGLAACIKPHFLLVPLLLTAWDAWKKRDARRLFTAVTVAGLLVPVAYGVIVLAFFPEFFGAIWPLLQSIYLKAMKPLVEIMITNPVSRLWIVIALVLAFIVTRLDQKRAAIPFGLVFAAFTIAFWAQGKAFIYHLYPAAGIAVIAVAYAVLTGAFREKSHGLQAALCAGALFFAGTVGQREPFRAPELLASLQALPPRSTLITVTDSMEVSIGILGQTELRWASRAHLRWITVDAEQILAKGASAQEAARLEAAIEGDRRLLRDDILKLPDVIVFDSDGRSWEVWARKDPDIAAALARNYSLTGKADGGLYAIYRKNITPSASEARRPHLFQAR